MKHISFVVENKTNTKMKMKMIKYSDSAKCPKCGGMLAYDATMRQRLPMGFGFAPGSGRFQVDSILMTGFRGECMECEQQVFAVKSQRQVRTFPKSINAKLQKAAAQGGAR